ncbi:MAG: ribosome biogenesis GTPase Der, partial [bacterium]
MNIVSIIGRPNVGKSTLFNRLIERKKSVTHETPGTTRDRIYGTCKWGKYKFTLVDTGGLDITSQNFLNKKIFSQIEFAFKESSLFLFLLDGQVPLSNLDYQIADILRRQNKKVIVVINKIDNLLSNLSLGYELGFEKCIEISSLQGLNIDKLLDETVVFLNIDSGQNISLEKKKIAIMGKPNVGKSSLINAWLGKERVIIDDNPGTTIDSIDIEFSYNNNYYTLFDTAGIRRKTKIDKDLEIYSVIRAIKIIQQVDIVLLLIDATQGISDQDKKILYQIEKHNKSCIILCNKWDLVKLDKDKYFNKLKENFPVKFYPFLSISALTKQRIFEVFNL